MSFLIALMLAVSTTGPVTRPATRPAKTYHDFASILQEVPADITPRTGEKWQSIHHELLGRWLKDNAKGKRFSGKLIYTGSSLEKSEVRAGFEMDGFLYRGLPIGRCAVSAVFPASDAARFARLRPGDRIEVSGTVSGMHLQEGDTREGQQMWNVIAGLSQPAMR
jgi:hypothetical protein